MNVVVAKIGSDIVVVFLKPEGGAIEVKDVASQNEIDVLCLVPLGLLAQLGEDFAKGTQRYVARNINGGWGIGGGIAIDVA